MKTKLSMFFSDTGQNPTAFSTHFVVFCAELHGIMGFSPRVPLSQVPVELFAEGVTAEDVFASQWAAGLIAQAEAAMNEKLEGLRAEIAS